MNAVDYSFLSELLLESSGLSLGAGKEYLLEARLIPLAQSCGLEGLDALLRELRKDRRGTLATAVTEAMTTNETSFFRDKTPFEDLRNHLIPRLIEARQSTRRLRFWCAASSSGQESYSVLIALEDHFPDLRNWSIEFVATDISNQMLLRAEAGVYSQFEVQRGLPIQTLLKYFEQTPAGWQVKAPLRGRIKFRFLNLLDNFQNLGTFDIVFCRNVLIYFDLENKKQILDRLSQRLHRDGFLLLGAAETALGLSSKLTRYRTCASAVYTPAERVIA